MSDSSTKTWMREEIKNMILRRAYAGVFEEGIDKEFNLHKLAEENGIDNDDVWKAFEELKSDGLIDFYAMGGIINGTSRGLLKAEEHQLADEALIDKQHKIRTKLLVTLADIQDRSPHGDIIGREEWIREAEVNNQDFANNDIILRDFGLIHKKTMCDYTITPHGMEKVRDYKKRKKRMEDFERLEKLEGVTKQERGHKLEDLLAHSAEWENWEVIARASAQGTENDIIMHVGLHYFLCSCKWESDPIQGKEAELLESRVRRRPPANGGILFSMSGLTAGCINEIRMMIASALIVPFGPEDIKLIMQNKIKMTDLLADKIDQIISHRKLLLDGDFK